MQDKLVKLFDLRIKNLEEEFKELHKKMDAHLQHSGEVLANIAWLKQSYWWLAGAVMAGIGGSLIALVKFLVMRA